MVASEGSKIASFNFRKPLVHNGHSSCRYLSVCVCVSLIKQINILNLTFFAFFIFSF